jgi:hypothetical protein
VIALIFSLAVALAVPAFPLVTAEFDPIVVGAGEWIFHRSGEGLAVIAPEGSVYDSPLLRRQRLRPR